MLVVVMTGDGNIEGRKMGGVRVPWVVGSHEELGYGGVFKEFVGCWFPCVEVRDGAQTMKRDDELGAGRDDGVGIKGSFFRRQVA